MRTEMKNLNKRIVWRNRSMRKRIMSLFMVFILVFTISDSAHKGTVQAESRGAKAKKAYAKILSDTKAADGIISISWGLGKKTKFALIDINKDGISELIFTPDDGYHVNIVSYVDGKAKNVGYGFSGDQKYYPAKHIYFSHTTHTGDDIYTYYKFTGKKMKVVAEKYGNDMVNAVTGEQKTNVDDIDFAPYEYTVKGKTVSAKKYNSYVKNILSGAKSVKPKWHRNTKANRSKYLL